MTLLGPTTVSPRRRRARLGMLGSWSFHSALLGAVGLVGCASSRPPEPIPIDTSERTLVAKASAERIAFQSVSDVAEAIAESLRPEGGRFEMDDARSIKWVDRETATRFRVVIRCRVDQRFGPIDAEPLERDRFWRNHDVTTAVAKEVLDGLDLGPTDRVEPLEVVGQEDRLREIGEVCERKVRQELSRRNMRGWTVEPRVAPDRAAPPRWTEPFGLILQPDSGDREPGPARLTLVPIPPWVVPDANGEEREGWMGHLTHDVTVDCLRRTIRVRTTGTVLDTMTSLVESQLRSIPRSIEDAALSIRPSIAP